MERSGERELQKNDGAEQSAEQDVATCEAGMERREGVTEIGWSAERPFRRSRSSHMNKIKKLIRR